MSNVNELAAKAGCDRRIALSFVREFAAGLPEHVLARTEQRRRLLLAMHSLNGTATMALSNMPEVRAL